MGTPFRALICSAALLAAPSLLAAEDSGQWGCGIGLALPSGGSKQWVGTSAGADLAMTQTYALGTNDAIRMRFGYFTLKASSSNPDTLILPGNTVSNRYAASTTNQLYAFTYGAEYLRVLPARLYVLGGLGVTYVSATRTGTFDLTTAGQGLVSADYNANNFVPYLCLGLGVQVSGSVSVEARWQTTSMKAQQRNIDLSNGSGTPYNGQVVFDKMNPAEISIGLAVTF